MPRQGAPRYIFLDTWVFSLLRDPQVESRLTALVRSNGFTVLITSISMVELYNPGWQRGGANERGAAAARFLAHVPCVIVNPERVWEMEAAANFSPLEALPVELDLSSLAEDLREATLLGYLRRDDLFLKQNRDIQRWSAEYEAAKASWLPNVAAIIEHACIHGNLKRDRAGRFVDLNEAKAVFLFSLDCRHAERAKVDTILAKMAERHREGDRWRLTAVRLSSLCFWYSYVDVDKANQPKRRGSDFGDFCHISLLPYCSTFTADGTMYRTLQRVRDNVEPLKRDVMTKLQLQERLQHYV